MTTNPPQPQLIAAELKAARTAWLEQHGVPISEEFAKCADAIGKATDFLEAVSWKPAEPTPSARSLLDSLLPTVRKTYVDEGFNGPIYHYTFAEKAIAIVEAYEASLRSPTQPAEPTKSHLDHQAYESLLKRADTWDEEDWESADKFVRHAVNAAMDIRELRAALASLRSPRPASEWISVKERLPDKAGEYEVAMSSDTLIWDTKLQTWCDDDGDEDYNAKHVTHFRLPAAPLAEKPQPEEQ